MVEIASILGINIFMKARKSLRPSIYVEYLGFKAGFRIISGEMFTGIIPHKERGEVKDFIKRYQDKLIDMWNNTIAAE